MSIMSNTQAYLEDQRLRTKKVLAEYEDLVKQPGASLVMGILLARREEARRVLGEICLLIGQTDEE